MEQDVETRLYWLVKYCLSSGEIRQIPCRTNTLPNKEYVVHEKGGSHGFYKIGREVFEYEDDAIRQANSLRINKIASVKKQLKKLESMKFVRVKANTD